MANPLHSVHWEKVRILSTAHLRAETTYLETALRWSLAHAGPTGLLALGPRDIAVTSHDPGSAQITLYRCVAIAPDGSPVDYAYGPAEKPLTCAVNGDSPEGEKQIVYLAVAQDKTLVPPDAHSAQSRAVRESGLVRFAMQLTINGDLAGYVTLPVARIVRQKTRWTEDETYLPSCAELSGHYRLLRRCQEIAKTAGACAQKLTGPTQAPSGRALLSLLAPQGMLLDVYQTPRAYLERLIGAIAAVGALLAADGLPQSNPVMQAIIEAVGYAQDNAGIVEVEGVGLTVRPPDWGTAFQYVQDALDLLLPWLETQSRARKAQIPLFASG